MSMGFPRQEHWSGLPFPSPGDLPDPEMELASPAWQADFYHLSHLRFLLRADYLCRILLQSPVHQELAPHSGPEERKIPDRWTPEGAKPQRGGMEGGQPSQLKLWSTVNTKPLQDLSGIVRVCGKPWWQGVCLPHVPRDSKEIKPFNPKGNQPWIFIGRTDAEAETPVLWPPDAKSWLIGKDPDAGKDWRQEEKGTTEDEMVGWHHWLNGHEFEQTPGVGDGQGGLACCSPWSCKELDVTERLNWTDD